MNINDLHLTELHRFAELGRLSATLIHEISNPLSAAMLNLEVSDNNSSSVRQARRNMQVLRRYVEAARRQIASASPPAIFTLAPQLRQLKRVLLPIAQQAGVKLYFSAAPPKCKLFGDPVKLQQIITNLVVNAIQAYDKGRYTPAAKAVKIDCKIERDMLTVKVTDWGKGLKAAELSKLFETFYTTKSQGVGIGLAIVKEHVTLGFNGSIDVCSSRRHGTCFTIRLPIIHD